MFRVEGPGRRDQQGAPLPLECLVHLARGKQLQIRPPQIMRNQIKSNQCKLPVKDVGEESWTLDPGVVSQPQILYPIHVTRNLKVRYAKSETFERGVKTGKPCH